MPEGTIYNSQERVDQVVAVLRETMDRQAEVVRQNLLDQGFSPEQADVELAIEVPVTYMLGIIPPAIEMLRVKGITSTLEGTEHVLTDEQRDIGIQTQAILQSIAGAISSTFEEEEDVLTFAEQLEAAGARVTVDYVDGEEGDEG